MDLKAEYEELVEHLGKSNLKFEYFNDNDLDLDKMHPDEIVKRLYSQVGLTYLLSGKVVLGTEEKYQIENAISAMRKLKNGLT